MRFFRVLAIVTALLGAIAGGRSAKAAVIDVNEVWANWHSVVATAGTPVIFSDPHATTGNEEVRWGTPASGGERSGYRFDPSAPPAISVIAGQDFSLGTFTHFNFPIFGSITSIQLDITLVLEVEEVNPGNLGPLTFSFVHNETPNTASPSTNPINNDLVSLTNLVTSDTFNIDGTEYTLYLTGFSTDNGNTFTQNFSTVETKVNTATLWGYFDVAPPPEPADPVVPEPITSVLWGGFSVLGLAAAIRRRKVAAKV